MGLTTESTSAAWQARYLRQILLREIGIAGQQRLCASRVQLPSRGEPAAWRREWLARYAQRIGFANTDWVDVDGVESNRSECDTVQAILPLAFGPARALYAGAVALTEAMLQIGGQAPAQPEGNP